MASARYLSDARYITAKLRNRMRGKTPPVLEKKKEKKPEQRNLVTYSWCSASGLFSLLPVVGKVHAHIIAL